jgi:roadblock/LC7 domain-containing protein
MSIPAGKFLSDGKLVDYPGRQELPPDMLDLTAQFAAAVSQMLAVPGVAHTKISGLNWIPGERMGLFKR